MHRPPAEMLLLLNSVTDEAEVLTDLYFTDILDLFDGMEMLEVSLEDQAEISEVSLAMEISILILVCLFFSSIIPRTI